ncbi:hypothetical protein F7725_016705, partial [Dissostichus mawsoni]
MSFLASSCIMLRPVAIHCVLSTLLSLWALCNAQSDSRPPVIQLRLAGEKRKHYEGRLEVFYNGEWGTVCDDDFSISAAHVACRELGFLDAQSWLPSAKYGKGEGKKTLLEVSVGFQDLCHSNGLGVSDCKHSEDVGVMCNQKRIPGFKFIRNQANSEETFPVQVEDVRLRATYSQRKRVPITEGFLEVKDGGKWRQICNEDWTEQNSKVICGMYGFPGEKRFNVRPYKLLAKRRKKNYWGSSVNCTGNEADLSECNMGRDIVLKGNSTCEKGMPVVVSCVPGRAFAPSVSAGYSKAYRVEQPLVRLRGGALIGEGRVEVLKNGVWGTVCDDNWNIRAATVVCRELGFGSAKEALTGARLGQGSGSVHMNEVECSGFEKSLTECYFNREALGCNHEEDAAVRCNVPAMGFNNRLRLNGGRNPFEGRVEVLAERNSSMVWGTVCSDSWGTMEAMVVCRQLGLGFANNAFQETWYWQGDVSADAVVMSGVRCSGTELTLDQCLHHGKHVLCPKGGGRFSAGWPGPGAQCPGCGADHLPGGQTHVHAAVCPRGALSVQQRSHSRAQLVPPPAPLLLPDPQQRPGRLQTAAAHHSWVWHECHRHYHSMEVFTHYDLLTLNGTKVAEGHKASFCLEDTHCDEGIQKRYECANFGAQGITVGCWDTYRHDIDCQWIDITDLKPGDYIFQTFNDVFLFSQVVINPNFEVAESDYTNNIMKCRSRYDGQRIWTYNCIIGGSRSSETEETFPGLHDNQLSRRGSCTLCLLGAVLDCRRAQ